MHLFHRMRFGLLMCAAVAATSFPGCTKTLDRPPAVVPPPTYTGPAFLHGTVGSMTEVRGFHPQLVSGYGIVVWPPGTGTGSSEVPPRLRQWLINMMSKKGIGSSRLKASHLRPESFLNSRDTAVVRVDGFIPPAATQGPRFDVVVTALEHTQTTPNTESGNP